MLWPLVEFFPSHIARLTVLLILGMANSPVCEGDIEPRSYANIPVGINFLLAGYSYMKGNVAFAPALPIENAKLETHSSVFAYVRSLGGNVVLEERLIGEEFTLQAFVSFTSSQSWAVGYGRNTATALLTVVQAFFTSCCL